MSQPIRVDDRSFQQEVLEADHPVLVDFYADWCGPCKALAPVLEEIAGEWRDVLTVAKLNVDANVELAVERGVKSIPTLILFNNGQAVERITGFLPKGPLTERLHAYLPDEAAV